MNDPGDEDDREASIARMKAWLLASIADRLRPFVFETITIHSIDIDDLDASLVRFHLEVPRIWFVARRTFLPTGDDHDAGDESDESAACELHPGISIAADVGGSTRLTSRSTPSETDGTRHGAARRGLDS